MWNEPPSPALEAPERIPPHFQFAKIMSDIRKAHAARCCLVDVGNKVVCTIPRSVVVQ